MVSPIILMILTWGVNHIPCTVQSNVRYLPWTADIQVSSIKGAGWDRSNIASAKLSCSKLKWPIIHRFNPATGEGKQVNIFVKLQQHSFTSTTQSRIPIHHYIKISAHMDIKGYLQKKDHKVLHSHRQFCSEGKNKWRCIQHANVRLMLGNTSRFSLHDWDE